MGWRKLGWVSRPQGKSTRGDAMKLINGHVSEEWINRTIETFERAKNTNMIKALLELKQRRAIDRAKAENNAD